MVFHWSLSDSKSLQVTRTLLSILAVYNYYYSLRVFHISVSWRSFPGGLNDNKSPQISRTLLSILADLSNAVVWIVSTHPHISKSSSPFTNPLVTVAWAPITIDITNTFMFHSFFFSIPSKIQVLILLFAFFQFYSLCCVLLWINPGNNTLQNNGGARGVIVIVVGNEHGDTSSNPGRDWLHFT